MTPWNRLLTLSLVVIVFLYVFAKITDPGIILIFSFLGNVLAAPFGQLIADWVSSNTEIRNKASPAHAAVTALVILSVNVSSLLLINLMASSLIYSFDLLEKHSEIHFSDKGYLNAQIYVIGTISLCVLFPALTTVSLLLAKSGSQLSFPAFAAGSYLSLPIYFLAASSLGLEVGYASATAISVFKGVGALILLGSVLSAYMWIVAVCARKVLRLLGV